MVEYSLSMRRVQGSIPCFSIESFLLLMRPVFGRSLVCIHTWVSCSGVVYALFFNYLEELAGACGAMDNASAYGQWVMESRRFQVRSLVGSIAFFKKTRPNSIKILILRWPGIEPGSTAWKATMLTSIPPSLNLFLGYWNTTLETFENKFASSFPNKNYYFY